MATVYKRTATIAINTNLSDAVDIGNSIAGCILVPTIDSATLSFQGSPDGVTYSSLYDSAAAEVTTGTASTGGRTVALPTTVLACRFVKIRSGTAATPVTQTAARSLVISTKG